MRYIKTNMIRNMSVALAAQPMVAAIAYFAKVNRKQVVSEE